MRSFRRSCASHTKTMLPKTRSATRFSNPSDHTNTYQLSRSSPVQSLTSGTTSQPRSPQPLHWSPSRIDLAAVSAICSQSSPPHNKLIMYIVLNTNTCPCPINYSEATSSKLNPRLRPEEPVGTHTATLTTQSLSGRRRRRRSANWSGTATSYDHLASHNPSCKVPWDGEEEEVDRRKGEQTTSNSKSGHAWISPTPRGL